MLNDPTPIERRTTLDRTPLPPPAPYRRRHVATAPRPAAATVLGVLLIVGALLSLVLGVAHLAAANAFDDDARDRDGVGDADRDGVADGVNEGVTSGVFLIALGIAAAAAAFAVMNGLRWGWTVALVTAVVGLLVSLYGLFRGRIFESVLGLAASGAVLGYLFTAPVQEHYAVREIVTRRTY